MREYDSVYDYASVLPRFNEFREGKPEDVEQYDLVAFTHYPSGQLVFGEVQSYYDQGSPYLKFIVNDIDFGVVEESGIRVLPKKFWFLPEPVITSTRTIGVSHKRIHHFIGQDVFCTGEDGQRYEGKLEAYSAHGDSPNEPKGTYLYLEGNDKKIHVNKRFPIIVYPSIG